MATENGRYGQKQQQAQRNLANQRKTLIAKFKITHK